MPPAGRRRGQAIRAAYVRVGMRDPFGWLARLGALVGLVLALAACSTTETLQTAQPLPTYTSPKYAAIVVDANDGKVLYQTASEAPRYPASLTKMMTLYLLFEEMETGRVSAGTRIPVSDYARSRPPTKIGFKRGETIDVDSAIKAVVIKSANDVAAAIGEYLGGSEDNSPR